MFALHLVEFAHQLGTLRQGLTYQQAFTDEARPKEGD